MKREWKKIIIDNKETFYSVSNYGEVRNDSTGTILKGTINNNGYKMVHLSHRVDKRCSVHRLVMKAFCPCENMDDLQINHKDGDKTNNMLTNLEWCTALENIRHSYKTGLQSKQMIPCYQYTLNGDFIAEYANGHEAARKLNLQYSSILKCLKGEAAHYKTYQFKPYKKNKIEPWYNVHNNRVYVYTDDGTFYKVYENQKECAVAFGISESSVSRFINHVRELKGFIFSKTSL